MRRTHVLTALFAVLGFAGSIAPAAAQRVSWGINVQWNDRNDTFDRAYRLGYTDGTQDGRHGRAYDFDRDARRLRGGPDFRRGYAEGYRAGFDTVRDSRFRNAPPRVAPNGPGSRGGYQDPAFSRGQSEGYRRGFEDGRDRERYDAVRHGEYRSGDNGYFRDYGSRDAYKNVYRDGFRQGYEEGYRDGTRAPRR